MKSDDIRYNIEYGTEKLLTSKWFWGATAVSAVAVTLTGLFKRKRKRVKKQT